MGIAWAALPISFGVVQMNDYQAVNQFKQRGMLMGFVCTHCAGVRSHNEWDEDGIVYMRCHECGHTFLPEDAEPIVEPMWDNDM